jgi:uncharacterized damage-inducible protein DinB
MRIPALIERLRRTPEALDALVAGLSGDDWRWRPPEGGWSVLEIVNHMADEDALDFRPRLASTLEDPSRPWPKLNPEARVVEARYQDQDPDESVRRFRDERAKSLAWLGGVTAPDWEKAYAHPAGPLRAGDLFASWAAHDTRHLGQITKRLYAMTIRDGAPYSVGYAG